VLAISPDPGAREYTEEFEAVAGNALAVWSPLGKARAVWPMYNGWADDQLGGEVRGRPGEYRGRQGCVPDDGLRECFGR